MTDKKRDDYMQRKPVQTRVLRVNSQGLERLHAERREYERGERVSVANGSMKSYPREETWTDYD
jgi:hypothetical protein